jgi:hypothetical protein
LRNNEPPYARALPVTVTVTGTETVVRQRVTTSSRLEATQNSHQGKEIGLGGKRASDDA